MSELSPLSPLTDLDSPSLFPTELPSAVVLDDVAPICKCKRTVLDCVDVPLLNYKVKLTKVAGAGPFKRRVVFDCDSVPVQIETTQPSTSAAHVLAVPRPASRSPATAPEGTSTTRSSTSNATAHHMSFTRSAANPASIPAQDLASTRLEAKKKLSSQKLSRLGPADAQGPASKKISAPSRGISKVYAKNAPRSTTAPLSGPPSSVGRTSVGPSSVMQALNKAVTENFSATDELDVGRGGSGKRPATTSNGNSSSSSPRTSPAHAKHRSRRGSHVPTERPFVATTTAASVSPRPAAAADPAVQPGPGPTTTPRCSSDSSPSSPMTSTVDRSQATRSTNESLAPHLAVDNLTEKEASSPHQQTRNRERATSPVVTSSNGCSSPPTAAPDRAVELCADRPATPTRVSGDSLASSLVVAPRVEGGEAARYNTDSSAPSMDVSNSAAKASTERSIASTSGTVSGRDPSLSPPNVLATNAEHRQMRSTASSHNDRSPIPPDNSASIDAVEASSLAHISHTDVDHGRTDALMKRLLDEVNGLKDEVHTLRDQLQGYQQAKAAYAMPPRQAVGYLRFTSVVRDVYIRGIQFTSAHRNRPPQASMWYEAS
ncbi:hypothetical protein H0H87_000331 [Tephrocybe sp. NHM501043]|nr:hypothetical protein H0H87_000331 [Tephrocybe sp. NHM501043]